LSRILIVEDEGVIAQNLSLDLEDLGYEIAGILSSGELAIEFVRKDRPDLLLMDIALKGKLDGIDAINKIQEFADIPVIYLSAYTNDSLLERAKDTSPYGYLIKPYNLTQLRFTIETALKRSQAENERDEQAHFIYSVLNAMPYPFYVFDAHDLSVSFSNAAASEVEPMDAARYNGLLETVRDSAEPSMTEHTIAADGFDRIYEAHAYPLSGAKGTIDRIIIHTLDITEQRRVQQQYMESQKLESVGRLASGVAHDFSNMLSAIIGYSEMILMEIKPDNPVLDKIHLVHDAAERAASLTSQLLSFSARQNLKVKPVDIKGVINNVISLLGRIIGNDISLNVQHGNSSMVNADANRLEQVFMNLVINARDAMPKGGTITIETSEAQVPDGIAQELEIAAGPYLCIKFSDTGQGMDAGTLKNIFEPFFTTKKKGKGTGLGLATVYGIIRQHKGSVTVISKGGEGTTFVIHLPKATKTSEGKLASKHPNMLQGTESILVVDDEPTIRELVDTLLSSLGYTVHLAASAEEALGMSAEIIDGLDMLLTDLVMRGIDGVDLAMRLRKRRPELALLFMSGYRDPNIDDPESLLIPEAFIAKPLKPRDLSAKIRQVLQNNS
jgi:two-component system cell cycle sensor histidine kinase/response regulator CckA